VKLVAKVSGKLPPCIMLVMACGVTVHCGPANWYVVRTIEAKGEVEQAAATFPNANVADSRTTARDGAVCGRPSSPAKFEASCCRSASAREALPCTCTRTDQQSWVVLTDPGEGVGAGAGGDHNPGSSGTVSRQVVSSVGRLLPPMKGEPRPRGGGPSGRAGSQLEAS
jgi:hypothetical protein